MNIVQALREKCSNTEFFLIRIFLYSVRIQENTDQKKTPSLDTFRAVRVIVVTLNDSKVPIRDTS